jgi:hypothetical protein
MAPAPRVRALIAAGDHDLLDAVNAQDAPLDAIEAVADPVRAAAGAADGWTWVLDGTARPRPGALGRLLAAIDEAAASGVPAPVVLASAVLGPDGRAEPGHAAWYRRGDSDLAMRSARGGLLPIRAARAGSLLVRARTGSGDGLPAGPAAAIAWTGRLLRDATGYLVPASVADARGATAARTDALGRTPAEDAKAAAALLRDGAWAPKEKLWLAGEAAARASAALRERLGAVRP